VLKVLTNGKILWQVSNNNIMNLKITNNFSVKYNKTWACKTQKTTFRWKWHEMQWPKHQDACCD